MQITPVKRTCKVCNKQFELMEYPLHLQEEVLGQLLIQNATLMSMLENMELTYQYLNVDDGNDNTPKPAGEPYNDGEDEGEEPIKEITLKSSSSAEIKQDIMGLDIFDSSELEVAVTSQQNNGKVTNDDLLEFQSIMDSIRHKEQKEKKEEGRKEIK